jgi:hypothetical protein
MYFLAFIISVPAIVLTVASIIHTMVNALESPWLTPDMSAGEKARLDGYLRGL